MAKQQLHLVFGHGQIGIGPGISHNIDLHKDFPSVSLEVFNEQHEIGEDITGKEGEFEVVLVFETSDGIDMLINALNDCKHPRKLKNNFKKLKEGNNPKHLPKVSVAEPGQGSPEEIE